MIKLYLVRHAEAEGNAKRIFHGWTDAELTEKGHVQAALTGKRFEKERVDLLYSSSMKRTLQTAQYIAEVKKLPIIRTDKLKEINGGDWENVAFEELPHRWPHEYDTWENKPHIHRMPNGESIEEFQERLLKEIHHILDGNDGKSICIVTHGTAIKAMLCYFYGRPLEELINIRWHDNTSVSVIEIEDGRYKVLLEGDKSHLGKNWSTIEQQDWWIEQQEQDRKV